MKTTLRLGIPVFGLASFNLSAARILALRDRTCDPMKNGLKPNEGARGKRVKLRLCLAAPDRKIL
jgi:hypothetical protein